jgi:hypothetical protein
MTLAGALDGARRAASPAARPSPLHLHPPARSARLAALERPNLVVSSTRESQVNDQTADASSSLARASSRDAGRGFRGWRRAFGYVTSRRIDQRAAIEMRVEDVRHRMWSRQRVRLAVVGSSRKKLGRGEYAASARTFRQAVHPASETSWRVTPSLMQEPFHVATSAH